MDGFHGARAAQRIVASAPGVAAAEPQLTLPVRLSAPGAEAFEGAVTLLDFASPIWAPTVSSGAAPTPGAPLLSARRIRRMDVPSTLRVME